MRFDVIQGDNMTTLKGFADNSFDSVVTDSPYGLGEEPDAVAMLRDWVAGGHHEVTGRGFMGKTWDAFVPQPALWAEVYRVLKPGGHLLSFAGSRTVDLIGLGLRLAGFEIRDSIIWISDKTFPKSRNIAKDIDKMREDDIRPVCRFLRAAIEAGPYSTGDIAHRFGFHPRMVDHWAARDTDSQPAVPRVDQWFKLKALLGFGDEFDAEVIRLNERKGTPGEAFAERPVVGSARVPDAKLTRPMFANLNGEGSPATVVDVTTAAREDAREWEGWGTALKPSAEPIILARKPCSEPTIARNVLKWGTGAINIDATRVPVDAGEEATYLSSLERPQSANQGIASTGLKVIDLAPYKPAGGRWPANVIHDGSDAVLAEFPQTGPARAANRGAGIDGPTFKAPRYESEERGHNDAGGSAARFFYCPKASNRDRDEGLDDLRTEGPARANSHPTVKPTALMRYLVRLVTPPGGVVLDPFAGSGSTLKAAILEGFDAVGLEQDAHYCEIARRRTQFALETVLAEAPAEISQVSQMTFLDNIETTPEEVDR